MAVKINRNKLTQEIVDKINQDLLFTPEEEYSKKPRYKKVIIPEPIKCYLNDVNKNYICIPKKYGENNFPELLEENDPLSSDLNFTGKLLVTDEKDQEEAANEAIRQIDTHGTTTLALPTGFGKTVLGCYLSTHYKYLTVVLVSSGDSILLKAWYETYKKFSNAGVWVIGEKDIPMPNEGCNVIICMSTRVKDIPEDFISRVGCLIIDEAHHFCTNDRIDKILYFTPKVVIVETATLERDDNLHKMIYRIADKHMVYRPPTKVLTVYKIETGINFTLKKNHYGDTRYDLLIKDTYRHEERNNKIISSILYNFEFYGPYFKPKILVLVEAVEHISILIDKLYQSGTKYTFDVCYGKLKSYYDCDILIGTKHKLGTGFDPANVCNNFSEHFNILYVLFSTKKYQNLTQYVGRVERCDHPIIYHFIDNLGIYASHWGKNARWYRRRNSNINIIPLGLESEEEEDDDDEEERTKAWIAATIAKYKKN